MTQREQIAQAIDSFWARARTSPTVRELAHALDLSPSTVHWHLNRMVRLGLLERSRVGGKRVLYHTRRSPLPHLEETPTYSFFVPGIPVAQGSKRHVGKGKMVESAKALVPWRLSVHHHARAAGVEPTGGPLGLRLYFLFPRPAGHFASTGKLSAKGLRSQHKTSRPDLDKLARAVLDALHGSVYQDDAQVVRIFCEKRWCAPPEEPGVLIEITAYEPGEGLGSPRQSKGEP